MNCSQWAIARCTFSCCCLALQALQYGIRAPYCQLKLTCQHCCCCRCKPAFTHMSMPPPSPQHVTGGLRVGQLLLGGADSSLAQGPFITTPLQPNLWRTDFTTGPDSKVFWQFNPRRISLVLGDSSRKTLCAKDDVRARRACTVIADTGYDAMVVGNKKAREAVLEGVSAKGFGCAKSLQVCVGGEGLLCWAGLKLAGQFCTYACMLGRTACYTTGRQTNALHASSLFLCCPA